MLGLVTKSCAVELLLAAVHAPLLHPSLTLLHPSLTLQHFLALTLLPSHHLPSAQWLQIWSWACRSAGLTQPAEGLSLGRPLHAGRVLRWVWAHKRGRDEPWALHPYGEAWGWGTGQGGGLRHPLSQNRPSTWDSGDVLAASVNGGSKGAAPITDKIPVG